MAAEEQGGASAYPDSDIADDYTFKKIGEYSPNRGGRSSSGSSESRHTLLQQALSIEERDPQAALTIFRELCQHGTAKSTMRYYLLWGTLTSVAIVGVLSLIFGPASNFDKSGSLIMDILAFFVTLNLVCTPVGILITVIIASSIGTTSARGYWVRALAPLGAARCHIRLNQPDWANSQLHEIPRFKVPFLTQLGHALVAVAQKNIHYASSCLNGARAFSLTGAAANYYTQSLALTEALITRQMASRAAAPGYGQPREPSIPTPRRSKSEPLSLSRGVVYQGSNILFKVRVANPGSEPVSDVRVNLVIPRETFAADKLEGALPLLEDGESATVTFKLRPMGECGDRQVGGNVTYYDYSARERKRLDLRPKQVGVICPLLRRVELTQEHWRRRLEGLITTQEDSGELTVPAETLFELARSGLEEMNLFGLAPTITRGGEFFHGRACYYGEGVKGMRYGLQLEAVGGPARSKLLFKAWAEREEALLGFYHRVLDEVEKRTAVKEYLSDLLIQHIHGDYISGDKVELRDSVLSRSNIGQSKDGLNDDEGSGAAKP